jgi:hypothetical protein
LGRRLVLAESTRVFGPHPARLFRVWSGRQAVPEAPSVDQSAMEKHLGPGAVAIPLLVPGNLRQDLGAAAGTECLGDLDGLVKASCHDETACEASSPLLGIGVRRRLQQGRFAQSRASTTEFACLRLAQANAPECPDCVDLPRVLKLFLVDPAGNLNRLVVSAKFTQCGCQ